MGQNLQKRAFSIKNRYFIYIAILLGAIITNTGVLFISSGMKILSAVLILVGALIVVYSLYIITRDRFHIKGYKR